MTIYLASRYSRKLELREYAKQAESNGIKIGSRWLLEEEDPNSTLDQVDPQKLADYATKDYDDIGWSDVFVFFSEDPKIGTPRGGRHTEFGFAVAHGTKIVVIGKPENIFHYLPWIDIEFFDNWDSALAHLVNLKKGGEFD